MNTSGKIFCIFCLLAIVALVGGSYWAAAALLWMAVVTYIVALAAFNRKLDEADDKIRVARGIEVPPATHFGTFA